jgi:hypothetical protein
MGDTFFLREEIVPLTKRDQDGQQQTELKENISKVRQIMCENRRLTVRIIAEQANIEREAGKALNEDLEMRNVCAKRVPKSSPKTLSVREFYLVNK